MRQQFYRFFAYHPILTMIFYTICTCLCIIMTTLVGAPLVLRLIFRVFAVWFAMNALVMPILMVMFWIRPELRDLEV